MSRATKPQPPDETLDLSGRRIGEYHILRKLGQGGMGQVYLAEQISLKRKVALKILRPDLAASEATLTRFRLEAEAVARATHANIVQVYDYGEAEGLRYMALEYVEGRTLKDYINKKGPPELLIALSIMRQVASALARAAELGITHRDIKPDNILLTRKGEVKVADFGLSRHLEDEQRPALNLTQTGVTMGTPLYMAPEQVEGKAVDPRTDIYSFGVTCYHMFAGRPPFRGETAFEVALAHVQSQPEPLQTVRPDLPEALCAVIHKMMAKAPEQRYQTGRELQRDIIKVREGLSGVLTSSSIPSIQVEPALLNTIIPPDQSVIRTGKGSGTEIAAAAPPPPPPKPRWALLAAAVVVTMLIAATGGAALGWRERAGEGPLPHGEYVRPADALAGEGLRRPSERERELREKAEPYLTPSKDHHPNVAQVFCSDLALFYLDAGRLDDAAELFQRMEKFSNNLREAPVHRLGQLGRAVVLALRHRAKESNAAFKDVFTMYNPKVKYPKEPLGGTKLMMTSPIPRKAEQQVAPIKPVLSQPRWHYYLTRARYLNLLNGLKDEDMPPVFVLKAQELDPPKKNSP